MAAVSMENALLANLTYHIHVTPTRSICLLLVCASFLTPDYRIRLLDIIWGLQRDGAVRVEDRRFLNDMHSGLASFHD